MNGRLLTSIVIGYCLALGSAAEPSWVKIDGKPLDWPDSLPLLTKQRSVLVLDTPMATHLRGFILPSARKSGLTEPQIRTQIAELVETLPTQERVDLKIEWLTGDEQPVDFTRSILPENGVIRSSYRIGGTRVTRTVIADEEESAIFIHLLADKPGALSFRVQLGGEKPQIEDRRQLVRSANAPAGLGVHVWVIPFESDVTPDGDSIIVRGEGEALVLLTYAAASETTPLLAETLARLGKRYDPGHVPPDPSKIWHGVLATHLKSAENSP